MQHLHPDPRSADPYADSRFRSPPRSDLRSRSPAGGAQYNMDRGMDRRPEVGQRFSPQQSRGFSSERNNQTTSGSVNWWDHNPKTTLDGVVKEFIDEFTGLIEVVVAGETLTAFFHATSVSVINKQGNPYGPPIKFMDVLGQNTATTRENKNVSLSNEVPVGMEVMLQILPVKSDVVQFVVLFAWPKSTEAPLLPSTESEQKILEKKQEYFLKEFHNKQQDGSKPRVDASFPGCMPTLYPDVQANVYDIKNESFGSIEIKGTRPKPFRFFALFHKDDVWLRDGKKGITVDFFKHKPLIEMCKPGQPVNVVARSLLVNKGADLAPAVMELQAIVVSLDPEKIPSGACRPTW